MRAEQIAELKPFMRLLVYGKWKNDIPLFSVLGDSGNLKIPSSIAIFNMSSAHDCPSFRLGLCTAYADGKHICYAIRSETAARPNVLPYRRKQEKFWLDTSSEDFCVQFISRSILKPKPFTALRFNEAGDFHSQSCVDKAEKIARILKRYGVISYCYTCRSDLDFSRVEALRISGSGFKKPGIVNIFRIIPNRESKPRGYGLCPMSCYNCTRCLKAGMKTAVVRH